MESPHQELQGHINSLANYGLERFSENEMRDELDKRGKQRRVDEMVELEGGYSEDPFKAMYQGMRASMAIALEDGLVDSFVKVNGGA